MHNSPFPSEESDDTESDRRASDADEEEAEVGQSRNGTEDGHKTENGVVATPPPAPLLAPTSAPAPEVDELEKLEKLPPYFPAIQGCRSVEEFVCLNRYVHFSYCSSRYSIVDLSLLHFVSVLF